MPPKMTPQGIEDFGDGRYHQQGGTDVPVADGGTGASTSSGARSNLGANDASNLTTGTVPDGRMPAWSDYTADTKSDLEAANVPASRDTVTLFGHISIGDGGGARYKRVGSEPSHPGKIQSSDGAWWEIAERIIPAEALGMIGDWDGSTGTDNNDAWVDFVNCCVSLDRPGALLQDKQYLIGNEETGSTGAVTITESFRLIGNDAKLVRNREDAFILAVYDATDVQGISAIDNTESFTINDDGGSASTVARLTVTDASAYAKGDFVKVVSDDVVTGFTEFREGEDARVSGTDEANNYVYLYAPLAFAANYVTNPRIAKRQSDKTFRIDDLEVEMHPDHRAYGDSWGGIGSEHFTVYGAYRPIFTRLRSTSCLHTGITLYGCLEAQTQDCHFTDHRTNSDVVATSQGYGIIEYSCERGRHIGLSGHNLRHVYTTGGRGTDADSEAFSSASGGIFKHGRAKYSKILFGYAWNCQHAGFDTHPDAYKVEFHFCTAEMPHFGNSGNNLNFQLRGIDCTMADCLSIGEKGFQAIEVGSGGSDCEGHHFIDCEHRYLGHEPQFRFAFRIVGNNTGNATGHRFIRPIVRLNGSQGLPFRFEGQSEGLIEDPHVIRNNTSGTVYDFVCRDDSTMRVRRGRADYRNAGGAILTPFRADNGGATIEVDDFEVLTGGVAWDAVFSAGGSSPTFKSRGLRYDRAPSSFSTNPSNGSTVHRPSLGSLLPATWIWLDACTVTPSRARLRLMDEYIGDLVEFGLWDALAYVGVLAAHTEQAALLNLKDGATWLTNNGASFTADEGFTGDGSSAYLEGPEWNVLSTDDNHIGAWVTDGTDAEANVPILGQDTITGGTRYTAYPRDVLGEQSVRVCSGTVVSAASATIIGYMLGTRRAASESELYRDGVSVATGSESSQTISAQKMRVFNHDTAFSDFKCPFVHIGSGLTDQQVSDLYDRTNALLTELGAV